LLITTAQNPCKHSCYLLSEIQEISEYIQS
jgi:hypothetical protein